MASFVEVEPQRDIDRDFVVSSTGKVLAISISRKRQLISSVVDKNNRTVRHVHAWLRYLSSSIGTSMTKSSVKAYGRGISYFCDWLEKDNRYPNLNLDQALEVVNRQDILDYHCSTSCDSSTKHHREAIIKECLTFLATHDGNKVRDLENSPWGRTDELGYVAKKGNKKSPKIITTDHIISLLKNMHNECERCMFHTQYDTGLRISELIDLRISELPTGSISKDQSFEFLPLYIRGLKGRGTGVKDRITLISRATLHRIRKYHQTPEYKLAPGWKMNDPNKPVFLTTNQKPWSSRNASKQFKSAVLRALLDESFKTHWVRHGTAFSVLTSDIAKDYTDKLLTVKQMFGHSNISTTEIYTQLDPTMLANFTKSAKKMNRLDEAEQIRKATYLAPLKHKEKRGHRE